MDKFNEYIQTLELQARLNQTNLDKNRDFMKTGVQDGQPVLTRSIEERYADVEKLKIQARAMLNELTDADNANITLQYLVNDNELLILFLDSFSILNKVKDAEYAGGMYLAEIISWLTSYKQQRTDALDINKMDIQFSLDRAVSREQLTKLNRLISSTPYKDTIPELVPTIRRVIQLIPMPEKINRIENPEIIENLVTGLNELPLRDQVSNIISNLISYIEMNEQNPNLTDSLATLDTQLNRVVDLITKPKIEGISQVNSPLQETITTTREEIRPKIDAIQQTKKQLEELITQEEILLKPKIEGISQTKKQLEELITQEELLLRPKIDAIQQTNPPLQETITTKDEIIRDLVQEQKIAEEKKIAEAQRLEKYRTSINPIIEDELSANYINKGIEDDFVDDITNESTGYTFREKMLIAEINNISFEKKERVGMFGSKMVTLLKYTDTDEPVDLGDLNSENYIFTNFDEILKNKLNESTGPLYGIESKHRTQIERDKYFIEKEAKDGLNPPIMKTPIQDSKVMDFIDALSVRELKIFAEANGIPLEQKGIISNTSLIKQNIDGKDIPISIKKITKINIDKTNLIPYLKDEIQKKIFYNSSLTSAAKLLGYEPTIIYGVNDKDRQKIDKKESVLIKKDRAIRRADEQRQKQFRIEETDVKNKSEPTPAPKQFRIEKPDVKNKSEPTPAPKQFRVEETDIKPKEKKQTAQEKLLQDSIQKEEEEQKRLADLEDERVAEELIALSTKSKETKRLADLESQRKETKRLADLEAQRKETKRLADLEANSKKQKLTQKQKESEEREKNRIAKLEIEAEEKRLEEKNRIAKLEIEAEEKRLTKSTIQTITSNYIDQYINIIIEEEKQLKREAKAESKRKRELQNQALNEEQLRMDAAFKKQREAKAKAEAEAKAKAEAEELIIEPDEPIPHVSELARIEKFKPILLKRYNDIDKWNKIAEKQIIDENFQNTERLNSATKEQVLQNGGIVKLDGRLGKDSEGFTTDKLTSVVEVAEIGNPQTGRMIGFNSETHKKLIKERKLPQII